MSRGRQRYKSTGMVTGQGDPSRQQHGQCLNCGARFYPCQADRAQWYARKPIYFCKRKCAADWGTKEAARQAQDGNGGVALDRAVVRLRWTAYNMPHDSTMDLPADPHSQKSTVLIGRHRVIVNVSGVSIRPASNPEGT